MLTRKDLTAYKDLTGFNLGQIEKDYLQHIFLLNFYRKIKDELVFKGGTALQKTYGLNRFSEDLDFTIKTTIATETILKTIITNMKIFGCETSQKKKKEDERTNNYILQIKGPLYDGTRQSQSFIRLDISKREKVEMPIIINTITPIYKDLPPYTVPVMNPIEIMAEKIRAILTRNNARDMYDLWFLIQKKTRVPLSLINSKLKYYKKVFEIKEFTEAVEKKEKIWEQEMNQLIPILISYKEIKNTILSQHFIEP
ncbi:MAG: nucleotidyl transferase AbiEii/AbiGii toxin family protein [Candidatus Thermoplasmatota archaeon]|nr:nucleotidyl transferase AbiEii/AbiGii toxin family protein [Candidatus Thermoplasmatota archaeon]MBU1940668.1 nucleotidyl transferase AbiEii/AbiGii toxin family protein [Candidatus Thermoplasmatota archaeon]